MNTSDNSNAVFSDKERAEFVLRVEDLMHQAKVDYDELSKRFGSLGYQITSANLKTYINKRNPSLKVLIYLSRALSVSLDFLVGNNECNLIPINDSFDREVYGSRYAQYPGKYIAYFYPTRTNDPEKLIEATLTISKSHGFLTTLEIPIPEGDVKKYTGHLVLSKKTDTAFISLAGQNGELIQFTFNDPNTNKNRFRFAVSALISVSSGDAKRMPTLSRAIISEHRLTNEGLKFLEANLRLNSKYINIQEEELKETLYNFFEEENISESESIYRRLISAFKAKTYYTIEEQYFLNTFCNENRLTDIQIETLIANLRTHSISSINNKTPKSIDSRLYLFLDKYDLFVTPSEQ